MSAYNNLDEMINNDSINNTINIIQLKKKKYAVLYTFSTALQEAKSLYTYDQLNIILNKYDVSINNLAGNLINLTNNEFTNLINELSINE